MVSQLTVRKRSGQLIEMHAVGLNSTVCLLTDEWTKGMLISEKKPWFWSVWVLLSYLGFEIGYLQLEE